MITLAKVLRPIIDGDVGAEGARRFALFIRADGRQHVGAECLGELDGGHADAARAAVDQKFFASLQAAALEDVVPDGEERLGDGGRFDEREGVRLLDAAQLGSDGIFGVAAAR